MYASNSWIISSEIIILFLIGLSRSERLPCLPVVSRSVLGVILLNLIIIPEWANELDEHVILLLQNTLIPWLMMVTCCNIDSLFLL